MVSVVMPTFNCEKYIAQTIESVLSQTYTDFEILVIDDCSSDNTVDLVKKISDPRIKLFVNDVNKGTAFSRNLAISESKGEYIAFLDGDDLWEPTKLEQQISFMKKNDISFSYTQYDEINEDGTPRNIVISGPKVVKHNRMKRMCYPGCLTVMYKKSVYPDLSIPNDIRKRNDYALWLKLSTKVNCYLLPNVLAHYRRRNSSISSGKKSKLLKYHADVFSKVLNYNKIHSWYRALVNVVFYFYKKLIYRRKL